MATNDRHVLRVLPAVTPSFAIRRVRGAVVLRVQGDIDIRGSGLLERVLSDLIEGQGNLRVVVDLAGARVRDAEVLSMFRRPVEQARRHGTHLAMLEAPPDAREALQRLGLGEFADRVVA
ncbi:MAG: STAS domain-containing protein [Acidimicrobiales bacterium]